MKKILIITYVFLCSCTGYSKVTVLKPINSNDWLIDNYVAIYNCGNFSIASAPVGVKLDFASMGPMGLPILPVGGGAKAKFSHKHLQQEIEYPEKININIEVFDSDHWDFKERPNVSIIYNNKEYTAIQQINIDHNAEYIYAFDLYPQSVENFVLKFTKTFEGCDIKNLEYIKSTEHDYTFNVLQP